MLQHGRRALPQPVHVHGGDQIAESVIGSHRRRLPDRPFGDFAVAQQDPDAPVVAIQAAGVGHAHPHAEALAEGPGGHVDEWQCCRRMALEVGIDAAQIEQLILRDVPHF